MTAILKWVFYFGPLIFAFGFLAPMITQSMILLGLEPPFGMAPLAFGLIVAGAIGLVAQYRGRWI